jgi:hypothetical protein
VRLPNPPLAFLFVVIAFFILLKYFLKLKIHIIRYYYVLYLIKINDINIHSIIGFDALSLLSKMFLGTWPPLE